MSEMTEERLAELRGICVRWRGGASFKFTGIRNLADAMDELDRLRALVERREAVAVDQERAAVGANLIAVLAAENERLRKTTCTCERYWNGLLGEYRSLPDDSCPIHNPEPTS